MQAACTSRGVEFPDVAGWRRPEWTEMQELKEKGGWLVEKRRRGRKVIAEQQHTPRREERETAQRVVKESQPVGKNGEWKEVNHEPTKNEESGKGQEGSRRHIKEKGPSSELLAPSLAVAAGFVNEKPTRGWSRGRSLFRPGCPSAACFIHQCPRQDRIKGPSVGGGAARGCWGGDEERTRLLEVEEEEKDKGLRVSQRRDVAALQ